MRRCFDSVTDCAFALQEADSNVIKGKGASDGFGPNHSLLVWIERK
jgi:hypothetical protein